MTFHGCAESAITSLLYRKDRAQGQRYGLPSPLFWWTHRALTAESAFTTEADYALFLLSHFANSGIIRDAVSVVVANDDVRAALLAKCKAGRASMFATRIVALSSLAAAAAATPSSDAAAATTTANGDHHPPRHHGGLPKVPVVLFLLGGYAGSASANVLRGPALTATFAAAQECLILIGHAMWQNYATPTHPIQIAFRKFSDETWKLPVVGDDSATRGLAGGVMPLCCPSHPAELLLVADTAVRSGETGFCRRVCLQTLVCHRPLHVCLDKCHPGDAEARHATCPYACGYRMRCGHTCAARCGDVCNCFMPATRDLDCGHFVTVGVDVAADFTETPLTQWVRHTFDGACVDSDRPCEVAVPVDCRLCSGAMTVPCHAYAVAKQQADTAIKADDAATADAPAESTAADPVEFLGYLAECPQCIEQRRGLERDLLVELLMEADTQREQRRRAVEGQMHEQHKAAQAGMFTEGQRVSIKNVAGVRGAIDYLFPEVETKPAGLGWCDAPIGDLLGDHGRIAARHVDLTDTNEVLYLVALSRGGHTVVADTGLELLRALVRTDFEGFAAGTAGDMGSMLLIAGGPSSTSAYAKTDNDDGEGAAIKPEESPDAIAAKLRIDFPVGSFVHCVEPVVRLDDSRTKARDDSIAADLAGACACAEECCDGCDCECHIPVRRETNICGTVDRIEGPHVIIRCERRRHEFDTSSSANGFGSLADMDDGSDATSAAPSMKSHRVDSPAGATNGATAAPRVVSVTENFTVQAVRSQIELLMAPGDPGVAREPRRHVHDPSERGFFEMPDGLTTFVPTLLAASEAVVVKAVINYPFIEAGIHPLFGKTRGPCYVVVPMRDHRSNATRVAIVPTVFVDPDAEAKAEKDLHRDLKTKLISRVEARFSELVEPRALSNIEARRKRLEVKGRLFKKQIAVNGGKAPVGVASWGGGAKSANLERPAIKAGSNAAGAVLDRHAVHAAAKRNEAAVAQEPRRVADVAAQYTEMATVSRRYDAELTKALAGQAR